MIVVVHSFFGFSSGISQHAENFTTALERLGVNVVKANLRDQHEVIVRGDAIHITLCGVQEFPHVFKRREGKNIAYIAWESTEYPKAFIDALEGVDQLWVPSQWQKDCSDKSVPKCIEDSEFCKVVPEGVNPNIFKPSIEDRTHSPLRFLIFGRWEDRKATKEMIYHFLQEFAYGEDVELVVSADNAFPVDGYTSTEERLEKYGLVDSRISVVHFPSNEEYLRYLQEGNVLLHVSRSEGWGLVNIEGMACGIPTICQNWSGNTEFCENAILVKIQELIKPFNVYGVTDCPGAWCEPDWTDYREKLRDVYNNYAAYRSKALIVSRLIRENFSWAMSAKKAADIMNIKFQEPVVNEKSKEVFVVGTWPNGSDKMMVLEETIGQIHAEGYEVVIATHFPLPQSVVEKADYIVYEKNNILSGDWRPVYNRRNDGKITFVTANKPYHGVAVLNNIRNAIDFCSKKWEYMYYIEYDIGVELDDFIAKKQKLVDNKAVFVPYEGVGIRTDLWCGDIRYLDRFFPRVSSWKEYISSENMGASNSGGHVLEIWLKRHFDSLGMNYGEISIEIDNLFDQTDREVWEDDIFNVTINNGISLNIAGISNREYDVVYSSPKLGNVYSLRQKTGMWSKPNVAYYQDWTVRAFLDGVEKYKFEQNLKDKRVFIGLGSKALGDTLAWTPFLEEFRKKHDCKLIASTWWNKIFDYPEIEFIEPGQKATDIHASYEIGCYDNDLNRNVCDWRTVTLQQVATDILGLELQEIKPKLKFPISERKPGKKFFCFSEFSTMNSKLWHYPNGWQKVIDELNKMGYVGVSISAEPSSLMNIVKSNGMPIEQTMSVLSAADFYIGLGHGPSWLAWALGVPSVLISGFSEPFSEFPTKYRLGAADGFCRGCYSDLQHKFTRDWEWCPRNKAYECSKSITPDAVLNVVKQLISDKGEN